MAEQKAGRIAVVTGAGSGLGRALAIALTAKGITVAGLGRRAEKLEETAVLAGAQFLPIVADVADPDAVRTAFGTVRKHGAVSILINNAAVYPHRDILDETPESFMHTMAVNLGGVVNCTSEALTDMTALGHGRILNVGSFSDLQPLPCSAAYSVSKGAVSSFSRALVADLGDRLPKIVINTWMPGILRTDMGLEDGIDPTLAAEWGATLALWDDPSLNGAVFDRDREVLLPRGLKGRVKDLIRMQRRQPRRIVL
ncbi:SDR family oxidoreductase [Shimia sp. R9_3]|uniref:SDR family NAD(P)-dependent oxidoreductase n=1 Tax=Shimia sp. R9_3 TaxID=2821113 RepID=UPI001ADC39CB|nr:SDR family oxidoreductase [Shimia sp. R9_3]MBO9400966.1 SDR family oxidoreductase [Shimia sp. R9_3]